MKTSAIILAILFGFPLSAASMNTRKVAKKDMQYSVLIRAKGFVRNPNGALSREMTGCSGTYISPYEILTAAHCFQMKGPLKIWIRDEFQALGVPANLKAYSVSADLALLSVAYPHTFATLGRHPKIGDPILNVGSPLFYEFVASEGIVGLPYLRIFGSRGGYMLTTGKIEQGSSGGGVFDSRGRLVGANTMMRRGYTFAVDVETIKLFLELVKKASSNR